jgi:hypothetical protein
MTLRRTGWVAVARGLITNAPASTAPTGDEFAFN